MHHKRLAARDALCRRWHFNVTAVGIDVADVDANAEFQALVRRYLRISSDDAALNFDRTSDRVNDARKLGEDAIACGVGDVAAVPLDRGIAEFAPTSRQLGMRAFFVGTHQPAVSSHVSRENGREVASNSRLFQISAPRTRNKILPISARPDQKRQSPLVGLNVICCETPIRLESGAKRKWLVRSQNVAVGPKAIIGTDNLAQ